MLEQGGRAAEPQRAERLRQRARSLLKRWAPAESVEQAPPGRWLDAWPLGARYVLAAIWPRLGIAEVLAPHLASPHVDLAGERALWARVANRACAPSSQLDGDEPWRREDGRRAGTAPLARPHLDRAREGLDAQPEAREHALACRLADRLSRDVDLMVYATTFLHGESAELDWGVGEAAGGEGRLAAGAKTSQAPRPRGLSPNGRGEAPPMLVGVAVTREGLPVRPWVFPGPTVEVTTVAHVKADLRGWPLSRGVGGRGGDGVTRAPPQAQREWGDLSPVSAPAPRR